MYNINMDLDPTKELFLIDKPTGITSFGVVSRIRRILKEAAGQKVKVGHTGTLDPFASGLLILLAGKGTKRSNDFLKLDKWYEATIYLGASSTTGDPEGEITEENSPKIPTEESIKKAIKQFHGKIHQKVPAFSAVKINGRRAYDLARKGQKFDTPTREVEIYAIEILDYHYPELKIRTHVSSGTYIRTLGEDLGKALDTSAYLTALRRTKVGPYSVTDALALPLE